MPQKKKPNPFNLDTAISGLTQNQPQQVQPPQQTPYDLMAAMQGLRGPDTSGLPQLPPGPSHADRPIGQEPLGDLVDFFGGLLGIQNPISPEASRMTQVAGGLGAAVPLLPGIYSRLQQAISGIPSKMTSVSKALQVAGQVPEEARATGLLHFIQNARESGPEGPPWPQGQIPTHELQQYVQDNPLGLTEGVGGVKPPSAPVEPLTFQPTRPIGENFSKTFITEGAGTNHRFGYYQLSPGDTAVTQYVAKTPYGTEPTLFTSEDAVRNFLTDRHKDYHTTLNSRTPTHYDQYVMPGGSDYTERNISWNDEGTHGNGKFSSHPQFDPGNMIGWSRSNVHETPNGPMKFIEEIQSDWHQKGNDKGYQDPVLREQLNTEMGNANNQIGLKWKDFVNNYMQDMGVSRGQAQNDAQRLWLDRGYGSELDPLGKWSPDTANMWSEHLNAYNEMDPLRQRIKDNMKGVPWAPFTDNKWGALMAKREIYDAAKNDLAGVAWTPGAVQNQRWSLSQVADQLKWRPPGYHGGNGETTGLLLGFKDGDNNITHAISESDLPNYVGKNVAQQLIANPNVAHDVGQMEIGKKGMNQFYDNYLPGATQKFMQPFGGRVEQVGHIGYAPGSFVDADQIHTIQPDFSRPPVKEPPSGLMRRVEMPVMGMKLTPEMKKLILQKGFYALSPLLAAITGWNNGPNKDEQR